MAMAASINFIVSVQSSPPNGRLQAESIRKLFKHRHRPFFYKKMFAPRLLKNFQLPFFFLVDKGSFLLKYKESCES
jgi:hypothetical protein